MWTRARSGLALKARRWRFRHGIAAQRVAIRSHAPWWMRLAVSVLLALVVVLIARGFYDAGRGWSGLDVGGMQSEVGALRERLAVLETELISARQQADSAHSTLQIERAAQEQLAARIRTLESDNARLREDMLMFESLAGSGSTGLEPGFRINRLAIEPDAGGAGRYRYRMLVARVGGKGEADVRGVYQIVASIDRAGQGATIALSPEAGGQGNRLTFRHFQRVDGVFTLPQGARLLSVEARFLQDGQIRARATASP